MSEPPRRRRVDEDLGKSGGGGLPLFPLVLVVIFAGLLLGGVLAHFLGGRSGTSQKPAPAVAFTNAPLPPPTPQRPPSTPQPRASVAATAKPTPRASRAPTAQPSPTPARSAEPSPVPTAATAKPKTAAPKPSVSAVSRAVVYITPAPVARKSPAAAPPSARPTLAPAAAATVASNYASASAADAAGIVRSYLGAIARGDRATATSYLAHGLPSEGFMDPTSRILSIRPENSGNQQYKVTADVQTSTGEYFITFRLQPGPGGLQITDHFAIKTQ